MKYFKQKFKRIIFVIPTIVAPIVAISCANNNNSSQNGQEETTQSTNLNKILDVETISNKVSTKQIDVVLKETLKDTQTTQLQMTLINKNNRSNKKSAVINIQPNQKDFSFIFPNIENGVWILDRIGEYKSSDFKNSNFRNFEITINEISTKALAKPIKAISYKDTSDKQEIVVIEIQFDKPMDHKEKFSLWLKDNVNQAEKVVKYTPIKNEIEPVIGEKIIKFKFNNLPQDKLITIQSFNGNVENNPDAIYYDAIYTPGEDNDNKFNPFFVKDLPLDKGEDK